MKILILIILLFCAGCGGSEIRRQLVDQNRQAGRLVAETAISPRVQQAGIDIEANAVEHSAWIGKPKSSQPYGPVQSASIRADSKQQRESSWWLKIKNFFGGRIMEAILEHLSSFLEPYAWVPGLLWGGWEMVRRWKADKKVMAGYDSVGKILNAVKKKETLSVSGIKGILKNSQTAWNVWPQIKKDLDKLWKKNKIKKVASEEKAA